jgi:hypothetical protein
MSDLRNPVRRAAERYEPPSDWLERIQDRAQSRRRNRRLAAVVVGLGVPIVLLALVLANVSQSSDSQPAAPRCQSGNTPEPTAFWRAESTTTDVISGIVGGLRGDAGFGPGIVGNAFVFDGEGDFFEVPDGRAPHIGTRDFTISLWVKFASTQGEQVLIEDWIANRELAGRNGWTLTKLKTNVLGFGTNAGGVDSEPLDLAIDTWIHVVARQADGEVSTFVDGRLVANGPLVKPNRSTDTTASLKIGHRGSPDDTPGSQDRRGFFLNGSIDEVALYIGHGPSDSAIRRIYETRGVCLP